MKLPLQGKRSLMYGSPKEDKKASHDKVQIKRPAGPAECGKSDSKISEIDGQARIKQPSLKMFESDAHAMEQNYLSSISNKKRDIGVQYSARYTFSAESKSVD